VADSSKHPATNRTVELYREVKAQFEPIPYPHLEVDTCKSLDLCVKEAFAYIATH